MTYKKHFCDSIKGKLIYWLVLTADLLIQVSADVDTNPVEPTGPRLVATNLPLWLFISFDRFFAFTSAKVTLSWSDTAEKNTYLDETD